MRLYTKFLLVLMIFWNSAAIAQARTDVSPAHLAAAERLVYAMGLPERFIIPTKQLLHRSLEKDPANASLMSTVMNPYLEKKYTATQLKTFFAGRFDLGTCQKIAQFWEGPVGKKIVRNQAIQLDTGEAPALEFTAREKALIKQFESTKASKEFLAAMPEIEELFAEYVKNTQMKMREGFLKQLQKQSTATKT